MPIVNKLKTTTLFYKKWPYKITVELNDAYMLRRLTYEDTKWMEYSYSKLPRFYEIIKQFSNEDIKIRYGLSNANIYIKDDKLYNHLINALSYFFQISVTEPAGISELAVITSNDDIILCNHFPFNQYQYKISFREISPDDRARFAEWLSKYEESSIRVPKNFMSYLKKPHICWGTHYVYAIDQNMATLVTLFAAGSVKLVQKYTIRAEINNIDLKDLITHGD